LNLNLNLSPEAEEVRARFVQNLDIRHPGMLPRLGQDTDLGIAVDYGISRQRVHMIRSRLGINAFSAPYTPTEEDVALLGTMPDVALAERLGTYCGRVLQERRKRGIPAFSPVGPKEQKIEQHLDLLGVLSDPKFAKIAGVSAAAVYYYRVKYGIETKVISPKHKDFVKIDRDEVARLFHEGKTDEEIAEAVGGTVGTIPGIRKRLQLLRKEQGTPLSDAERGEITRLRAEGHSKSEVARRMGRPYATVAAFLRRSKG
jgi:DNA-binding CsgD family transcriptional regulator